MKRSYIKVNDVSQISDFEELLQRWLYDFKDILQRRVSVSMISL